MEALKLTPNKSILSGQSSIGLPEFCAVYRKGKKRRSFHVNTSNDVLVVGRNTTMWCRVDRMGRVCETIPVNTDLYGQQFLGIMHDIYESL